MNRFKVTTYNINLNMVKLVLSPYRLHNLLSKKISKVCRAFDLQYLTFVVILELEECIFWILCFIFWSFIFHFVYCVFFTFMPMLLEGYVFLGFSTPTSCLALRKLSVTYTIHIFSSLENNALLVLL